MSSERILHATPTPEARHPWSDDEASAIADAEYELMEERP